MRRPRCILILGQSGYILDAHTVHISTDMPQAIDSIQAELDTASLQVGALCDLLHAASDRPVNASSIHALLEPVARRLNAVAGDLADCAEPRTK